ncbi:MAG: SDR family oxidoreductase [Pseudomonadota bacterium]
MKHALVTGGTGGIGRGVAEALLAHGWSVLAAAADEAEVRSCPLAPNLSTAVLDVTDQASVDGLVHSLDRLDGLVNCAGILRKEQEYDLDIFRQVLEVNLVGTMRMCTSCHPLLAKSGGAIVNTGSMYSFFGGPHAPGYTASKGGVAQLTKALAGRWGPDGVRVNAIAPGWIETEMTAAIRTDPEREAGILGRTPLARWGQPREVGNMVAWLLSDEASLANGAIFPIDGGYAAM